MRWFAEGLRFVSITESQLIKPLTGGDIIDDEQKPRATLGRHLGQNFGDAAISSGFRTSLIRGDKTGRWFQRGTEHNYSYPLSRHSLWRCRSSNAGDKAKWLLDAGAEIECKTKHIGCE